MPLNSSTYANWIDLARQGKVIKSISSCDNNINRLFIMLDEGEFSGSPKARVTCNSSRARVTYLQKIAS